MIKNFKYMWAHHRSFVLLSWAYLIPAMVTYVICHDVQSAVCIGGLGIASLAPLIWKFS